MSATERLRATDLEAARPGDAAQAELGELGAFVGGRTVLSGAATEVRSPYDGRLVAVVHRAGAQEIEEAITRAVQAFEETRRLPTWRRAEILNRIGDLIAEHRDELARTIALEAGKPITTARVEAERAAFTFRIAAEETKRIYGEIVPLDWAPGMEGRTAHVRRVPLGPIVGISPFNFPGTRSSCARRPRRRRARSGSGRSCSRPAGRRAGSPSFRAPPTLRPRSSRTTGSRC
jgi:delta 1-pyrroline-5-carboxylate dehydrogenase